MAAQRAFYVTQGSLTVWWNQADGDRHALRFADSDDGLRRFDAYLASSPEEASFLLVDVIEEEFSVDGLPKLGFRDRHALTQRRLQAKYPRTRYRLPIYQGRDKRSEEHSTVIYSAITNHELVDPWLKVILRHQTPLSGLFSIPLMAPALMQRIFRPANPTLFVTLHQGTRLRQVFCVDGYTHSARLSEAPAAGATKLAQYIIDEAERSRRYLERTRLLGNLEQLDVVVVGDDVLQARFARVANEMSSTQYHCVSAEGLAKRTGLAAGLQVDKQETLYLAAACQRQPKSSYAVSGENRYWSMRRLRHAVTWSMVSAAAACALVAGFLFSDALLLDSRMSEIEAQITQLSESFRRENEDFDPIRADSHEMKVAVDTGNYILRNRLPVPWVMQQLGLVLGDHPQVQILNLSWEARTAVDPNADHGRSRDRNMPVAIPAMSEVEAEIHGELRNFDGNMRLAFAEIDRLVANLEAGTLFTEVIAVEYPLDARPQASISGEILNKGQSHVAQFRLRLRYPLNASDDGEESYNDDV